MPTGETPLTPIRQSTPIAIVAICCLLQPVGADDQALPPLETKPLERFEYLQIRMAIPVRITVYAPDEATANQATNRAYARFKQLDRLLSDYDPDSELSRLCTRSRPGRPTPVSQELFALLRHAEQVSRLADGAFDVTVGPLTDLWRRARRRQELPAENERESALARVGWKRVTLNEDHTTVTLQHDTMRLDLGGIAKGFAADEARRILAKQGLNRALIDAGGDVVAGDPPPGADLWRIGIAPLDSARGEPSRFLGLRNASVATSGDASQHVEIDGVRYSHIVDPRTGLGLTTPSSVTVTAPTGVRADSLASAVSVLGPEKGIELIERLPGCECFIVTRESDDHVRTYESSEFGKSIDLRQDH